MLTTVRLSWNKVLLKTKISVLKQIQSCSEVCIWWIAGSADQASDINLKPRSLNEWFEYVDYVRQRFLPFIDSGDITTVDEIIHLYGNNSLTATPELCVTFLVSDMRATCPLDEMTRVAASVSQSPIYRFQVGVNCCVKWFHVHTVWLRVVE